MNHTFYKCVLSKIFIDLPEPYNLGILDYFAESFQWLKEFELTLKVFYYYTDPIFGFVLISFFNHSLYSTLFVLVSDIQ